MMKNNLPNQTKQTTSPSSKKQRIAKVIIHEIENGKLRRKDKIPSRKALAKRFNVDPKTIDSAVQLLIKSNILFTKARFGTFVCPSALLSSKVLYGHSFSGVLYNTDGKTTGTDAYLQIGFMEINPYYFLQSCMSRIARVTLKLIKQSLTSWAKLKHSETHLTDLVRQDVSIREGKAYMERNVMLLTGKYHTLRAIVQCLAKPGDVILVAAPALYAYTLLFKELGAEMWEIPRSASGIPYQILPKMQEKAKKQGKHIAFLYTNIQLDYMTGNSDESALAMKCLLDTLEDLHITVVEEFEDHEVAYGSQPTFSDVATNNGLSNVISIRSYSKLLAMYNELRVVLAPADVITTLRNAKALEVRYGFLYEVLASMLLEANVFSSAADAVSQQFEIYKKNMVSICEELLGKWAVIDVPLSGICFWMTAKSGYDFYIPIQKLNALHLPMSYVPQENVDIWKTNALLMGFGDGDTHELKEAIRLIGEEMEKHYC